MDSVVAEAGQTTDSNGTSLGATTNKVTQSPPLVAVDVESQQKSDQSQEEDSSTYDYSSFNQEITLSSLSSNNSNIPPRGEDIDRWQRHISLQNFAKDVERAAKSVYANDSRSRYSQVHVLVLKWKTEDPKLPVSYEIAELCQVLDQQYHYDIQVFEILDQKSHAKVNEKISAFIAINDDSKDDLKIVYYAGHSRLSATKDLVWVSGQNRKNEKSSTVTWTGIQHSLEQAESDVLILLDCCSSGIGDGGEGNGVTELMSACAFDVVANGVGHYSFTKALTTELRLLGRKGSFPVVELYTRVYCRAQHHMSQGLANERYPAPIHLVLTRDDRFPRSIQLSIQNKSPGQSFSQPTELSDENLQHAEIVVYKPPLAHETNILADGNPSSSNNDQSAPVEASTSVSSSLKALQVDGSFTVSKTTVVDEDTSRPVSSQTTTSNASTGLEVYSRQLPWPEDVPRLLFAVRLADDIQAEDLSTEYFADWLRIIPAFAKDIIVEGGFKCDSTLVLVTLPFLLLPYLTQNPAIICLGPVKSSNILLKNQQLQNTAETKMTLTPLHFSTRALGKDKVSERPDEDQYGASDSDTESSYTPKRCTSPDRLSTTRVDSPDQDRQKQSTDKHEDDSSLRTVTSTRQAVDSLQNSTTSVLSDFGRSGFKNIYSSRLSLYSVRSLGREESIFDSSSSYASSQSTKSLASSAISRRSWIPWSRADSQSRYAGTGLTVPSGNPSRRESMSESTTGSRMIPVNKIRREVCWCCEYLRKPCNFRQPCSVCAQMSGSHWGKVGCRYGTLKSKVSVPSLCTEAPSKSSLDMIEQLQGRRSRNIENRYFNARIYERENQLKRGLSAKHTWTGSPKTKRLLHELWSNSYYSQDLSSPRSTRESLKAQSGCILDIVWEIASYPWNGSFLRGEWMLDNLVYLLALAAIYQATWKSDHLIALSILCLRSALDVMSVKAVVGLNELSHQSCSPALCRVECIAILNMHLKRYLDELSRAFSLGKDLPSKNSWWLSGFYSLCIQSIVRKALLQLDIDSTSNNGINNGHLACREYLYLPVRLFIALFGSYDPLVGAPPPVLNSSGEDVDRPHPQEYISARLAVRQADWLSRGISGSGDYLKEVFEDHDDILQTDSLKAISMFRN